MSIINLLITSIYGLRAHKVRVFLTMIGIIIGITSVVTILSIGDGLKKEVNSAATSGAINKITISFTPDDTSSLTSLFTDAFTSQDINDISSMDGVEKVDTQQNLAGGAFGAMTFTSLKFFDKEQQTLVSKYNKQSIKLDAGRSFNDGDSQCILLSNSDCMKLFDSPEDAIGKGISILGQYFEVIGVQSKDDVASFFSLGSTSYMLDSDFDSINEEQKLTSINVIVSTNKDKKDVGNKIVEELKDSHKELKGTYKVEDPDQTTKAFSQIIDAITGFIAVVSGISLFVAGIGVMNIMYVSISERRREIGIRRAIGAYPSNILLQFLFEAVMVTFIGGLLGLLFGVLLSKIIGNFMPFSPVLTMRTVLISTITSILTGVIFGVIPARRAAKLPPIKAIYK